MRRRKFYKLLSKFSGIRFGAVVFNDDLSLFSAHEAYKAAKEFRKRPPKVDKVKVVGPFGLLWQGEDLKVKARYDNGELLIDVKPK